MEGLRFSARRCPDGDEGQFQAKPLGSKRHSRHAPIRAVADLTTCTQFFERKGSRKRRVLHINKVSASTWPDSSSSHFTTIGWSR